MKTALITGITGQDGSYLAELLLSKGYRVCGLVRRSSSPAISRIAHLGASVELVQGDLLDEASLVAALRETQPDEIYNLAAQSFVPASWNQPVYTGEVDALGVTRLLEAIRTVDRPVRFYQASSSEMYGAVRAMPQDELTPFYPRSPYGVAKAYAHFITVNYRESYGLWACAGIAFNHESPRRGAEFVTSKVARGAAMASAGVVIPLKLGNLEARRDWSHARDVVRAAWMMLQAEEPADYVIASGQAHSVAELAEIAYGYVGLRWRDHVEVDPALYRPAEVAHLLGDASRIRRELGWEPEVGFRDLVIEMVDAAGAVAVAA